VLSRGLYHLNVTRYLSATHVDHTCLRWTRITSAIGVSSNTAVSIYKP
jgi:hypothetical protein